MKRVNIENGNIGIVTKNGVFERFIGNGINWLGFRESLRVFCKLEIYELTKNLSLMLKFATFKNDIELITIKEDEIAVVYYNGKIEKVLSAGQYFYWKREIEYNVVLVDLNEITISNEIQKNGLSNALLTQFMRVYKIESYEEGLLFVDGVFIKKLGKGTFYYWKNTKTIDVLKVDTRQMQLELSGQEILTQDKAALRLNFYAQYLVVNAEKAVVLNKDFEKQLYILLQMSLREFVGTQTLDELLENKENAASFIMKSVATSCAILGVKIQNAGIRDIILPGEMKEIMNKVLIAEKQAQANVILRREEVASTRSMLNAAKLMEENEMLYKLKEMEYVERIASKIGELTVSGGGKMVDQLKEIFTK